LPESEEENKPSIIDRAISLIKTCFGGDNED
jgi:hypothetical protein